MKKTSIAAVNRIVKGTSNTYDVEGFWFKDNETGKYGVTDKYCCVMYDCNTDLSEFAEDIADGKYTHEGFEIDANRLFYPFDNQYHEWYSDEQMDSMLVKDIIEKSKAAKKNKGNDSQWYVMNDYGIRYNIELMRNVCEALDCKTVGIYYPFRPIGKEIYKPIVIIGDTGIGLVMPMR